MKNRYLIFFISLILMGFTTCLYPQIYSLKFSFYGPREGLSGNQVTALVQDRIGYIWFGTENGLNRFDGYEFKTLKRQNPFNSKRVLSLFSDSMGKLWAGFQKGVILIDPYTLDSRSFFFYSDKGKKRPLNEARIIMEDKRGDIWLGTGDALLFYNQDRLRFEKVDIGTLGVPGVFSLAEAEEGYFWISTGAELISYDTKSREFHSIEASRLSGNRGEEAFILDIHASKEGKLWIASNSGLYIYDYIPGQKFNGSSVVKKLPQEMILDIFISPDEDVWLGTMNGLIRMQRKTGNLIRYKENFETPHNLRGNAVYKLFMDRSGVFWIGTNRGVNKFDWGKQRFRFIGIKGNSSSGFKEKVQDISKGLNRTWIGTANGIKYYICGNQNAGYVREFAGSPYFKEPVSALHEDSLRRLWFSNIKGLFCYNLLNRTLKMVKAFDEGERGENVNTIYEDSQKKIWFGTERGLQFFHEKEENLVKVHTRNSSNINITTIKEVVNDGLYIGTSNSGVFKLNRDNLSGKKILNRVELDYKKDSYRVNDIAEGFKGKILIATDRGLLCINNRGLIVKAPYARSELSVRVINFIIPLKNFMTKANELWLGTETGLIRFNHKDSKLTEYRVDDGLLSEFFTKATISSEGTVFAGTVKGVTLFRAEEINPNLFAPDITLASLKIMGKVKEYKRNEPIKVAYDENVISLKFAALNYSEPLKNSYAYRLNGTSGNWIELGKKREITLFNLNPGDYILEVLASNSDSIWNNNGKKFKIVVTPPIWLTLHFRIGLIIILILGVFLIYNARVRMIRKQNKKLQELVENRTCELKAANMELEKLAQLDPLTQVGNRRSFFERAERLFAMAEREMKPIAIIMVDVDYFKIYNDNYGHQAGDECLGEMGVILKKSVKRPGDLVARYGGEEFIIMLYNTDEEGAVKVARRVRKSLKKRDIGFEKSPISDKVTVSQGVAVIVPDEKFNCDIVILAADTALYQAKSQGRDRIFLFNRDSVIESTNREKKVSSQQHP